MGLNSPPPHDLTAERADFGKLAVRIFNRLTVHKHDEMKHDYRADERLIAAALKTARQEALREAASKVRDRALLWGSHGGAKIGFPYGHLTIEGEYESMADELDRLASEGA